MTEEKQRDLLRDYYLSQQLSPDAIEWFNRSVHRIHTQRLQHHKQIMVWAAGFAVIFLSILVSWQFFNFVTLPRTIAWEMAANHRKHETLLITTSKYTVLSQGLSRLTFPIQPVPHPLLKPFELVGGRYCSVQRKPAAQIRLRKKGTHHEATLYVSPANPLWKHLMPKTILAGKERVHLWIDHDRLVGLIETLETDHTY